MFEHHVSHRRHWAQSEMTTGSPLTPKYRYLLPIATIIDCFYRPFLCQPHASRCVAQQLIQAEMSADAELRNSNAFRKRRSQYKMP
jgi:hypothetical protein